MESVVGQFEPYEGGWGRGFASPQNSQRLGAHFDPFGSEPQGRRRPQPPELKLTQHPESVRFRTISSTLFQ
jgi:hypothetical protein